MATLATEPSKVPPIQPLARGQRVVMGQGEGGEFVTAWLACEPSGVWVCRCEQRPELKCRANSMGLAVEGLYVAIHQRPRDAAPSSPTWESMRDSDAPLVAPGAAFPAFAVGWCVVAAGAAIGLYLAGVALIHAIGGAG